jgi:ribosomal protein L11 methyltransferase
MGCSRKLTAFRYTLYYMDSIQISIEASQEQQEILISELSELNAEGFEQTDTHLIAYFNEIGFNSYEVNEVLKSHIFHTITIEEKNWNEVWESNFQPVVVDDFCSIRASFHEPIKGTEHEIVITPKMSFGTGHHATTYMMISHMKDIDFTGKTVFDFGTGTGILAILAEKLGAASVKAIDVDEWSIDNTIENTAANGCSRVAVEQSSDLPEGRFDIILANINRNVILEYLPGLKKMLEQGGSILFSGLLVTDRDDIVEACNRESLKLAREKSRNNWLSMLFVTGM